MDQVVTAGKAITPGERACRQVVDLATTAEVAKRMAWVGTVCPAASPVWTEPAGAVKAAEGEGAAEAVGIG